MPSLSKITDKTYNRWRWKKLIISINLDFRFDSTTRINARGTISCARDDEVRAKVQRSPNSRRKHK